MASATDPGFVDGAAHDAQEVTPSDSAVLNGASFATGLYVGTGGDVTVVTAKGNTVKFIGAPSGFIIPVHCTKVKATGTTAADIVAFI